MTREEFEKWTPVRKAIYAIPLFTNPLRIGRYVIYTSMHQLGAVVRLNEKDEIVDGYTLFSHYLWEGSKISNNVAVNTESLIG